MAGFIDSGVALHISTPLGVLTQEDSPRKPTVLCSCGLHIRNRLFFVSAFPPVEPEHRGVDVARPVIF